MAFLNFFKNGSYTRIKEVNFDKNISNISLSFEILDEENGESILPDIFIEISRTIETTNYINEETEKIESPPNEKPEDQTQEDYDILVSAYTEATQSVLDNADESNAFSMHFNSSDLYENSNIEALCYEWVKKLPMFEGVEDA